MRTSAFKTLISAALLAALVGAAVAQSVGGADGIMNLNSGSSGGAPSTCAGVIDLSVGCTLGVLP